jgi:hypothetical protein
MTIPITDLIGDVVVGSIHRPGWTFIVFATGRYLLLIDLPGRHSAEAFDP